MKRLILLLVFIAPCVRAQSDPLNVAYLPSIDTNCAHAQYSNNIWMTDTMTKLRQDSGSPLTNFCYITIYGTQNEFADFQVHFHDTGAGKANLNVTVSNFVQVSPVSSTINCATKGQCVVYREAYMGVTIKTSTAATFYNSTGMYPDILIPAVDPYWGQTTNAFPYNVGASNCGIPVQPATAGTSLCNQSAWVDVLIPQAAPSGYYLGSVTVKSGVTTLATMPVILAVWQWPSSGFMPSTSTLKVGGFGAGGGATGYNALCTQMYSGPNVMTLTTGCGAYPDSGGNNDGGVTETWSDADVLLNDHRFSAGGIINSFPGSGSFVSYATKAAAVMNGTCRHSGLFCPLLGGKEITRVISATGSAPFPANVVTNFQTNFTAQGWGTAGNPPLYIYLCDEPNTVNGCYGVTGNSWTILNANATTYRGYSNPGIPLMVTTDYLSANANSALNSIDWMVVDHKVMEPPGGPLQNLSNYSTWLASSVDGIPRQWWGYLACGEAGTCSNGVIGSSNSTYPNRDVDGFPVANRASEWLIFKHGQIGELYFHADICETPPGNSQSGQGQRCDAVVAASGGAVVNSAGTAITWTTTFNNWITAGQNMNAVSVSNSAFNSNAYVVSSTTSPTVFVTNNPNSIAANTSSGNGFISTIDPWQSNYYSGGWGDGTLVYSGGIVAGKNNYMGAGVTTPLILPSVRLKHSRDGVQDFEYLYYLSNHGYSTLVNTQLAKWMSNSYAFNVNGDAPAGGFTSDLMDVRIVLGNQLHAISQGTQVSFSPTSLSFGNVIQGLTSGVQTVLVTSTGSTNLVLSASALTMTGPNAAQFAFDGSTTCTNNQTLTPGQTCNIVVKFTPNIVASFSANVSVADNVTGSPQLIPLSGIGIPAAGTGVSASPVWVP